ncbi:MAG: hypothetical protein K9N09_08610 [Candidatus Cloacimonetes bacterium]|nr:hypothetical protein [Candidatus Cloacimonadota bacterium]MCF7814155.1 hypothetical protein [Candidatus Cloacimonadota bacterium]MCF7868746.1 hypothetical protein [Candidatus Cloacimonadota bacterium]MCF7884154.1 hypothetical protein [Candidatus Cloacimonadota bacterium]
MNNLYFKINLNKYGELRRKIESEKKTFIYTAVTYVLIFVIALGFVISFNMDLNKKLESRKRLLNSIRDEIKSYEVSGEFLSKKDLERLTKISTQRIFWTRKLVALSEVTTDNIAITHFSFKSGSLSLYGITRIDKEQNEFVLIDNFINQLKNDEQINKDFPEIIFVKSRRDMEKDVEILRFQIDAISEEFDEEGGGL